MVFMSGILYTNRIKSLDVFLYSKLDFRQHIYYLFYHAIKLLAVTWTISFSVSSVDTSYALHHSGHNDNWICCYFLQVSYQHWPKRTAADSV
jgi:hypothetical protein